MDVRSYKQNDLHAAMNLINIHMAKLEKAVEQNKYPEACSALRAMQDEVINAGKVAATLSLSSHLNDQRR